MKRVSKVDEVLAFIAGCLRDRGEFPDHRSISESCGVARWQVGNVLSYLVFRGDLSRTQVAEKGTIRTPKYVYQLAVRAGDREGGAASAERVA